MLLGQTFNAQFNIYVTKQILGIKNDYPGKKIRSVCFVVHLVL